ncbi:MAG TPA: hypothetical protein VLF21_03000 [Candidatus Saccharimonadales bacterium]|nr:hypothetical protein [Candidatus Saccharimonadales bacterium]
MKDRRPRPIKKANRMRDIEFRETLGGTMPLPRSADTDAVPATYVAIWIAFAAAFLALIALIIVNLLNTRPISPESSLPGGAILPLNTTFDAARADQAKAIVIPAGAPEAGQQIAVPTKSSAADGFGDTYAIQGAAGIPASRQ